MGLLKWNIWQHGLLKQGRYLFSTPQRSQTVVYISETGTISKEILPMFTGYISVAQEHMSWLVYHALKIGIKEKDGKLGDEQVLVISERNFLPLDPFKRLNAKKDIITPLKDIAKMRHAEVRAHLSEENNEDARTHMLRIASLGGIVLIAIMVIMKFWRG